MVGTSKAGKLWLCQFSQTLIRLHQLSPPNGKKYVRTGFILVAMAVDIEQLQSSKKKHKKDRKDSDHRKRNDRDLGDLVVTEVEGKKKKRKERKKEREGAIDGALSFSLVLQRADSMHCMRIHL